jgi:tetratricopeptide (TPR) repeat protein
LSGDLQTALQLLGVFEHGFTRPAAAEVAQISVDTLAHLVQRSMVWTIGQGRYHIPHTLKSYIQQKPINSDQADRLAERHSLFYAHFLTTLEINGAQQPAILRQIKAELGNLLAGWTWAIRHQRFNYLDRCCQPLFTFYETQSQFSEGQRIFAEALAVLDQKRALTLSEAGLRGKLGSRLALFHLYLGEYEQAHKLLLESLALQNQGNQYREVAFTANALGLLYLVRGQYALAHQQFDKSLEIYEEIRENFYAARVLNNLGILANHQSNYLLARETLQRSLHMIRATGNPQSAAAVLTNLGNAALGLHDLDEAEACFKESQQIKDSLGDRWGAACCLMNLGQIAQEQHDYGRAEQNFLKSRDVASDVGKRSGTASALNALGMLAFDQQHYAEASRYLVDALTLALDTSAAVTALDILKNIADVLAVRGYTAEATQILELVLSDPRCHKQTKREAEKLVGQIRQPLPAPACRSTLEEIREKVANMRYPPLMPLLQQRSGWEQ